MEETSKAHNLLLVIAGDVGVARPGYALFARMQAVSLAYSTLNDNAPQKMRSCEPHASTDTFVLTVPLYVLILLRQYLCD